MHAIDNLGAKLYKPRETEADWVEAHRYELYVSIFLNFSHNTNISTHYYSSPHERHKCQKNNNNKQSLSDNQRIADEGKQHDEHGRDSTFRLRIRYDFSFYSAAPSHGTAERLG